MSAFETVAYFLDNPQGGVTELDRMKNEGKVGSVFLNVHSHEPSVWDLVRQRATQQGIIAGPWAHVRIPNSSPPAFSSAILQKLIAVADSWNAPGVVNAEKEIDGNQPALDEIALRVGGREFATIVEPILFANLNWTVVGHLPMYLEIFPVEQQSVFPPGSDWKAVTRQLKEMAHSWGIRCVYNCFGTYGGMKPDDFDLRAPYSLFTGDAIPFVSYGLWAPTSSGFKACKEEPVPPPPPKPPLTMKQVPFTGPYGPPGLGFRAKGPTAISLKRMQIRMGNLDAEFSEIDEHYNIPLFRAMKEWQEDVGIHPVSGLYGRGSWVAARSAVVPKGRPNAGDYALDSIARRLIQQEAGLEMVHPVPLGFPMKICQGLHETGGLLSNWALDWCAEPGAPIIAVEFAKITNLSGTHPSQDVDDPGGTYGWSTHYETPMGYRWFWTHFGTRASGIKEGVHVMPGQVIGFIGDQDFRLDHIHGGVTSPLGTADAKKRVVAVSTSTRFDLSH